MTPEADQTEAPPELRNDEIVLRPWREADADAVHAACQDAEIQRWMPAIPRPYTRDHALEFVRGEVPGFERYQFAITDHGEVVGSVGLVLDRRGNAEVGYWAAKQARGRGITTRGLRMLCRYGLEELGLGRLELITDPENGASQRVAEKVGFRREGVMRSHLSHPDGRRRDSILSSLLPGELR